MFIKFVTLSLFIVLVSGCVSTEGVFIEESNFSVKQHRIAITTALGIVKDVSQNGRVVSSLYHDKNLKNIEVTSKTKDRYITKVTILGSIRPYRVSVEVLLERRDPDTGQWTVVMNDEGLALQRANRIQELLNQSREETSTFDEENPF